jgi:NAD(P)-dependent dehydrogenase (short-subunit alcohol dehydrogenase family)
VEFDGASVLITGGTRGIGLATARRFLDLGARVTIGGRRAAGVERAAASLDAGDRVASVAADVSTAAGCRTTVAAATTAFGGIDVLFANAGNYDSVPLEEVTEEHWDRTMATHLKGLFFCVQAAVPALRASRGAVVAMASDAGVAGLAGGWAAYCAAKGGVVNLVRQLALDLAPKVRVNCIAAGPVATDHLFEDLAAGTYGGVGPADDPAKALAETLPLRRLITPEEVADAVVFLAASRSMTGAVLGLDAGTTAGLP